MEKLYFKESEDIQWLIENYPIKGTKECCKKLGFPKHAVQNKAHSLGLKVHENIKFKIRSQNATTRFSNQREKYNKISKEIKIDSPSKAYTLGFLWGDGHLRSCHKVYYPSFGIIKEDFDNIISTFDCWGTWNKYYYKKRNTWKEIGEARLYDPIIGSFLKNNFYLEKSTIDPHQILSIIGPDLKHMWWRGYSDADGCFYYGGKGHIGQFSICGNYDQQWDSLEQLLSNMKIKYILNRKKNKNGNSSRICIYRKPDILKLGEYLYHNNLSIGLTRKYEKFLTIKQSIKRLI